MIKRSELQQQALLSAPRSSSGSCGNLLVPKGTALLRNVLRSRDLVSFLALLASTPNGRRTSPGKGSCLKKVPRAKQRDHFGVMLGPRGALRKCMAAQGNESSLERPQKCCFGVTRICLMKPGYHQFVLVPHLALVSSFIRGPPCKGNSPDTCDFSNNFPSTEHPFAQTLSNSPP